MPLQLRYVLAVLLAALLAIPLFAAAAPRYKVSVVAGAGSIARDINNHGQVVGRWFDADGNPRAFLHGAGAFTDLGTFGGAAADAMAINDAGQIAGYAHNSMGHERAFLYQRGTLTDLATLGGTDSHAYAINRWGQIGGGASTAPDSEGSLFKAFSYAADSMTPIGALPNGDMSVVYGVNSGGVMTGTSAISTNDPPEHPSHAFIYHRGTFTDLGTLGGLYSSGRAINDSNAVVGQASTDIDYGSGHTVPHAYLHHDGAMTDLGTFGGLFAASEALDINNAGQVVGWADTEHAAHAFLFEAGRLTDLNTLIDPASGWTLNAAMAINEHQQIAATGCMGGECFALRLDLVTAVPEPATYAMLLGGLTLVGWRARRGRGSFQRSANTV